MLIARDAYLDAGGFDRDFFAYFEDVDLGWRLSLLGYRTVLAPAAVTYHRLHGTAGRIAFAQRLRLYERNALAMIYKNYEDESLRRVLPAAIALSLLRGLVAQRHRRGALGVRRAARRDASTCRRARSCTCSRSRTSPGSCRRSPPSAADIQRAAPPLGPGARAALRRAVPPPRPGPLRSDRPRADRGFRHRAAVRVRRGAPSPDRCRGAAAAGGGGTARPGGAASADLRQTAGLDRHPHAARSQTPARLPALAARAHLSGGSARGDRRRQRVGGGSGGGGRRVLSRRARHQKRRRTSGSRPATTSARAPPPATTSCSSTTTRACTRAGSRRWSRPPSAAAP